MPDSFPVQPNYSFQLIDSQFVDFPDDFLRFLHKGPVEASACKNLQQFGQLRPLLVQQQTENRYHLLAGYPCFTAIKALGIKRVTCQILPHSTPAVTLFSLQALHNFSLPQQSPILQAHLLQEAQRILPEEELFQLLSLMGHKPQRYKLKELIGFLQLDSSAIFALHQGILSQKSGKQLALLSHKDQQHLVNLISAYQLGGSKQQKIIEMVMELALRNNRPVVEIVNNWLPVQKKSLENMPQQVQGLMQHLHEQCSPSKTAAEKNFKILVQELQPSADVTIEHSLSFEDERLEIRLKFADAPTLREKWERIKRIVQ